MRQALIVLICVLATISCSTAEARKLRHFERGKVLASQSRYAEAILELRNALKHDPDYADAHLAIARAYEQTDDTVNAYRSYQRASDLLPDDIGVQLSTAKFLLKARQFQDARARATRVIESNPTNVEGHLILGSALAGMDDLQGAVAQLQQAIDLAPVSSEGYRGMAALLLRQGRNDEAQAQFEKAIEIDPRSADTHVTLAAYHWSVGDSTRAEEILRKSLEIQPEHAAGNRAMALLYMSTGRGKEAEPFLRAVARSVKSPEAELPLADYYVRSGRLEEAREILERAAATGNASAIVRLGNLDHAERHHDRAYSRIDALLTRQPANSEALIAKGRWLLRDGSTNDAAQYAEAATQRDPGNAAGHLLLGDVRLALGRTADAAASYDTVLDLNPRVGAAYAALSYIHLSKGDPNTSVEFARGALRNDPANDDARVLLARGLLARGELKRAAEEIGELRLRRPADASIAALFGTLKMRNGDRGGARAEFESILQRDPRNLESLSGLAALDADEGQIDRARDRVRRALLPQEPSPQLLLLAARVEFQTGDFAACERHLRAIIGLDPSHTKAYELLGMVYVRQQKLSQALTEFQQLLHKEPRSIGALTVVGMIYEASNLPYEAEKTYEKALQIDSRAVVAANNLAYMLAERGENLEYALMLARGASAVAKNDPVLLDTLGWIYYKKQQHAQAIAELSKAVQLMPENALYQFHLGLAYIQAGEQARGRGALQRALQLDPNFPGAAEARSRLSALSE